MTEGKYLNYLVSTKTAYNNGICEDKLKHTDKNWKETEFMT